MDLVLTRSYVDRPRVRVPVFFSLLAEVSCNVSVYNWLDDRDALWGEKRKDLE